MADLVRRIEIYEDKSGQFRFRRKAPNGEIVATSEAYMRRLDAIESARREFPTDILEVEDASEQEGS